MEKLAGRFESLGALEEKKKIVVSRGPELFGSKGTSSYRVEKCDEVVGKKLLDVKPLKRLRHIFVFPANAIRDNDKDYLRPRGGRGGLLVCRPPHVIVSAARNFAVYTDDYLIVPSGQIGIASTNGDPKLLKALTVYLNSDFAFYHQFLLSSQLGVKRPRVTINVLRELPVPLGELSASRLEAWADLHDRLAVASSQAFSEIANGRLLFASEDENTEPPQNMESLLNELNALVYEALGVKQRDRALVEDLVRIRLELDDGKLGQPAVEAPNKIHLRRYAKRLKAELDEFVGDQLSKRHDVDIVHDDKTGMIQVMLVKANEAKEIEVCRADDETAHELEKTRNRLRRQNAQWVYFDRSLQILEGRRTFLFKPMQRFHWTESQAMTDAAEIIAKTLDGTEG